jgi:hypothetical protein
MLQGDIERTRVLVFDLLRERNFIEMEILSNLASLWPEVLQHSGMMKCMLTNNRYLFT